MLIRPFRILLCTVVIALWACTSARAQLSGETFRAFSACDAGFFKAIKREEANWAPVTQLGARDEFAWIKVPQRASSERSTAPFSSPIPLAGLTVLSYFDEVSDLGSSGMTYFWGFVVAGKVDAVAAQLKHLIHDGGRLRRSNDHYARSEVKLPGTGWLRVNVPAGTAAGTTRIERVLVIEPSGTNPDEVRVSCSLQGGVTAALLQELRPDIDASEHPRRMSATLFEETVVPEKALSALESAGVVDPQSLWAPKFKRLMYTYEYGAADAPHVVTVEMQSNGTLINARELYQTINVQRLTAAGGLIQLKSRINGLANSRVLLTEEVALALPAELAVGQTFTLRARVRYAPAAPGDEATKLLLSCVVRGFSEAQKLFATLRGRTVDLSCKRGEGKDSEELAFIEEVGVAVSWPGVGHHRVRRYVRFEVEK